MKFLKILLFIFASVQSIGNAQVVSWTPAFPTDTDSITITFDASQGNQGLNNANTSVYTHTGVITPASTTPTDWKFVKNSSFNTAIPNALLQSLGNNFYRIKYHVRDYYAVPAGTQILKLAMVFRNAAGTLVGKDLGGSDIFIPIYGAGGLYTRFSAGAPLNSSDPLIIDQGQNLTISGIASISSDMKIIIGGVQVAQTNSSSISTNFSAVTAGRQLVKLTANNGTTTAVDSFYLTVRPPVVSAALPANAKDGITYLNNNSIILNLYAPNKNYVYAIGEFNNWAAEQSGYMNRTPDGNRYWIQINNLTSGQEYGYQYFIDGTLKVADPYCEKILDPNSDNTIPVATYPNLKPYPTGKTSGIVSVLQTNESPYAWTTTNYNRPKKTDLIIYELLVRDFLAQKNYKILKDTLDYLQNLGINAIELMPINEFENNDSWGYNPSFYFAPDKYYGTKNDLKAFIDECHSRGIAVIIDIALNHSFGQSPMVQMYFNGAAGKPATNSPWFNPDAKHPFNVGYDMNHESAATKYFVYKVTDFWVNEYKIDGYRFDLSKGFTQTNNPSNVGAWGNFDQSRINIWKNYADTIWQNDTSTYIILEHFAANNEEKVLAEYDKGMMLWGNSHFNYKDAAIGNLNGSNFSSVSHFNRGWTKPHLISYMESHDEERLMYENITNGKVNGSYSTKDPITALKRMEMCATFFLPIPGPKMIWQFGEVGYDVSINQGGRTSAKPIRWNYFTDINRKNLYDTYAKLTKFKTEQAVTETKSYQAFLGGAFKFIRLTDPSLNVIIIGNFDLQNTTGTVTFQSTGTWYDYLTKDSITISTLTPSITLAPGEFHMYTSKKIDNGITTGLNEATSIYGDNLFLRNHPNPIADRTMIGYKVEKAASVKLDIFAISGQKVHTLVNERQQAGEYELSWNGNDANGNRLSPGIYFGKLTAGNSSQILKMIVQ